MKKEPIDISALGENPSVKAGQYGDSERPSLAEACLDYIGIEQYGKTREFEDSLPVPYQQRLRAGNSLLIVVEDIQPGRDSEATVIEGRINYGPLPYDNPETVLASLRHTAQTESTTGEMVYGVKVGFDGDVSKVRFDFGTDGDGSRPASYAVKNCPRFTIEDLSVDGATGEIRLSEIAGPYTSNTEYIQAVGWRGDAAEYLEPGDYVLLEESPDAYVMESIYQVLQHPEYNGMHRFLESFVDGGVSNETTAFTSDGPAQVLDWMERHSELNAPNTDQRGFISDVSHELTMLQGPPGTGKTSTTIAPAVLARLLGYTDDGPCRTLVSGASNKAIDEVMEDVVGLLDAFEQDSSTPDILDDILLLRATEPPEPGSVSDEVSEHVTFATHWMDEWPSVELAERLRKHSLTNSDSKHVIVFATPRRTWHVGRQMIDDFVLTADVDPHAPHVMENPGPGDLTPYELFDMVVVDEASMMDLPRFLLAGTYYDSGGTILLSGDHRQLPPVQKHDWQSEYSPSITALAPHLSVLNFGRLLAGDDLLVLDDDLQEFLSIASLENTSIPLHQLQRTYRCHTVVAEFLERWVYGNLDGIRFESDRTATLPYSVTGTDGVTAAGDPDAPLVVVTYDDESHQQMNPIEATIASELISAVDLPGEMPSSSSTSGDSNEDSSVVDVDPFGVVTPHNAQRGYLQTMLSDVDGTDYASVTDIDTVEKFQGGEREMMIVSGTVSDPDYVAAESEFLLNLNRLNVAMSRMQQKLVVIASTAVFDHIPLDVDEYDQSLLWKGLAKDAGLTTDSETPVWSGTVSEFTGTADSDLPETVDGDTSISIYYIE